MKTPDQESRICSCVRYAALTAAYVPASIFAILIAQGYAPDLGSHVANSAFERKLMLYVPACAAVVFIGCSLVLHRRWILVTLGWAAYTGLLSLFYSLSYSDLARSVGKIY